MHIVLLLGCTGETLQGLHAVSLSLTIHGAGELEYR
jgi:hypothetical protein